MKRWLTPWRVAVVLVAVAWAASRLLLLRQYRFARWDALLELSAPRPFGHRVLVPLLARPLHAVGLPPEVAFGLWETVAALLLLLALRAVLVTRRDPVGARWLALLCMVPLAVTFLVPRRWPLYYPWDTPAMAVVVAAVLAGLRARYGWAVVLTAVGALNRESALLVPLCVAALRWDAEPDRRGLLAWLAAMASAWVGVRLAITLALPDNPGPALHFTINRGYRVLHNLHWLAASGHVAQTIAFGGWILFVWPWLGRRAGFPARRLGLVAAVWAAAGMVVANVYEPRAFGEAVVLGLVVLASGRPIAQPPGRTPAVQRFDAVAPWLLLLTLLAVAASLTRWSWLPVAQWPMPM